MWARNSAVIGWIWEEKLNTFPGPQVVKAVPVTSHDSSVGWFWSPLITFDCLWSPVKAVPLLILISREVFVFWKSSNHRRAEIGFQTAGKKALLCICNKCISCYPACASFWRSELHRVVVRKRISLRSSESYTEHHVNKLILQHHLSLCIFPPLHPTPPPFFPPLVFLNRYLNC